MEELTFADHISHITFKGYSLRNSAMKNQIFILKRDIKTNDIEFHCF